MDLTHDYLKLIHDAMRNAKPDTVLEATGAGLGGMIADNYGHWPAGIPPENIAAWQETVANWPVAASVEQKGEAR
jgi:hypothetical protein